MSATCNGGGINGVDDVHAAGRDGPDESVMRMNQRRRPSADRRRRCCTDVATAPDCYGELGPCVDQGVDCPAMRAVIPPAARRGRGSS